MRYDFPWERRALMIIEKRSVICCSVARALVRIMAVSIRARTDRRVVMLLAFCLPILVLITVQSLISRTHPRLAYPDALPKPHDERLSQGRSDHDGKPAPCLGLSERMP